mmetsp:Transcript_6456/g.19091  ORF Transcript_6456/g.19091 Transcript_6456/m.19091 type:complete len:264 (-) Transcript_6456:907-1698(-)
MPIVKMLMVHAYQYPHAKGKFCVASTISLGVRASLRQTARYPTCASCNKEMVLLTQAQLRMYLTANTPDDCINFFATSDTSCIVVKVVSRCSPHCTNAPMLVSPNTGMISELRTRKTKFTCSWKVCAEDFWCSRIASDILLMHSGSTRELMTTRSSAGTCLDTTYQNFSSRPSTSALAESQPASTSSFLRNAGTRTSACEANVRASVRVTMPMSSATVRTAPMLTCRHQVICRFSQFISSGCAARVQQSVTAVNGALPKVKYV